MCWCLILKKYVQIRRDVTRPTVRTFARSVVCCESEASATATLEATVVVTARLRAAAVRRVALVRVCARTQNVEHTYTGDVTVCSKRTIAVVLSLH